MKRALVVLYWAFGVIIALALLWIAVFFILWLIALAYDLGWFTHHLPA